MQDDHVRAKSKGGVVTVPACSKCNQSKGDKSQAEWLDYLMENDRYRWRRVTKFQKRKRSSFAQMVRKRRKSD